MLFEDYFQPENRLSHEDNAGSGLSARLEFDRVGHWFLLLVLVRCLWLCHVTVQTVWWQWGEGLSRCLHVQIGMRQGRPLSGHLQFGHRTIIL